MVTEVERFFWYFARLPSKITFSANIFLQFLKNGHFKNVQF